MIKRSRKASSVFLALLVFCCVFLSSCGKKEVVIGVQGLPATMDPQIETSLSAQDLFLCAFRGLLSNADGTLICDAAKEYTYSPDELTLTFLLHEGMLWSDGVNVTADDYAFAIERILSPETSSPYAQLLFSIDGAQEFYENWLSALLNDLAPIFAEEPSSL